MNKPTALSARQVGKRVNDGKTRREILRDVNLTLSAGEFVVVRGASGSGKTTLLAVLAGLLLPTTGEVWLGGEPVSRLRDHQRADVRRKSVGYVFQDFALIEGMTVLENVLLPLVPDGRADAAAVSRGMSLLERFGIAGLARSRAESLSGGESQRVALARARITAPPVLLLDEPTAHLDAERAHGLMDDLSVLCAEHTGVLVASHDPRVYDDRRVTRVLTIADGAVA
ncbi:MAG TPA: ATP-binding cassette domain-containing protein [Polyangiaceae bacterium]|nr:ATP-binding cassette domain-containing protein [Polyangiaceae bacterium]